MKAMVRHFATTSSNAWRAILFLVGFGAFCVLTASAQAPEVRDARTAAATSAPMQDLTYPATTITARRLLDLFSERPEIIIEVKHWIAERLTAQGVPAQEDTITDELLFTRVNEDARLRAAIAIYLRSRGYTEELAEPERPSRDGFASADEQMREQSAQQPRPGRTAQRGQELPGEVPQSWESGFDQNTLRSLRQEDVAAAAFGNGSLGDSMSSDGTRNDTDPLSAFLRMSGADPTSAGALSIPLGSSAYSSGLSLPSTMPRRSSDMVLSPSMPMERSERSQPNDFPRSTKRAGLDPEILHEQAPYNLLAMRDLYAQLAESAKPLKRFGAEAFATAALGSTTEALDQPVGPEYILGPGDVLQVGIVGPISQTLQRVVDSGGRLALPEIGMVQVAGLTMADAQDKVTKKLAGQLRGAGVDLSVARLRSVRVYIVGDVSRPGAYSVHSLSTPLSALYAAGGPTESGSYRTLEHLREGKVIDTIDLYDLLLFGRLKTLTPLIEGDTVRVPPAGAQVTVAGRVRRPAIYEVKPGMTLHDAVELAGGLQPTALIDDVSVSRIDAKGERQTLHIDKAELAAGTSSSSLSDGDRVQVGTVSPWSESNVYLEGHVVRPGRKPFHQGMMLHDALTSYRDMLPEPADEGEIIRLALPEMKPVSVLFSVKAAMNGGESIALQPFDTIRLRGRYADNAPKVTVRGEVLRPGVYPLAEGMTVASLVGLAGGFTRSALMSEADLASYAVQNGSAVVSERSTLAIGAVVNHHAGTADPDLKPGDVLTVHQISGWNDIGASVKLQGEFVYPGTYGLQPGERLSSVLKRAGGFRDTAYPEGAILLRLQVREFEERTRQDLIRQIESTSATARLGTNATGQDETATLQLLIQQQEQVVQRLRSQPATGRMVVHVGSNVGNWEGTNADIELRAGDVLVLPKRPGFVLVSGQVYNQSALTFTPGKTAEWYLQHAGGRTEMAEAKEIFVVRANGEVVGRHSDGGAGKVLRKKLDAGDVIVVPQKIIGGSLFWRNLLTTAQLFSSIAIPLAIAGI